jgi:hypothetical protein
MLDHGFLGFRQFKASLAHTAEDVERYAKAVDMVFSNLAKRDPATLLKTPPHHAGFFRLTKE